MTNFNISIIGNINTTESNYQNGLYLNHRIDFKSRRKYERYLYNIEVDNMLFDK